MRVRLLAALAAAITVAGLAAVPGALAASRPATVSGPDHQSTTGPHPPAIVATRSSAGGVAPSGSEVVLASVPSYLWRHGCGPTAVGMVVGYWDTIAPWTDLVAGEATTQGTPVDTATDPVNQMIASYGSGPLVGQALHVQDYALYDGIDDSSWSFPYPDRSGLGGAHADDCVADFMRTSWSSIDNQYGWSWDSDIEWGFRGWASLRYPTAIPNSWDFSVDYYYESELWELLVSEINAGHPLVALVDSDSDGQTDHFVTVVGYDPAYGLYACRDTWSSELRWQYFASIAAGIDWGVYSLHTFHPDDGVAPTVTVSGADSQWHNHDVTLTFTAADNDGGAGLFHLYHQRVGTTGWYIDATRTVSTGGTNEIRYDAVDRVGNWATQQIVVVRIDKLSPAVRTGPFLRVRKGTYARMRLDVSDTRPSCGSGTIVFRVFNSAGTKVWERQYAGKTFSAGWRSYYANKQWPTRGLFRYKVYATDKAGNPQRQVASQSVRVY